MIFGTAYTTGSNGEAMFFPDHCCMICRGSGRCGRLRREVDGEVWRDPADLVTCDVCVGYGWIQQRPDGIPTNWSPPWRACKFHEADTVYHPTDSAIDPLGPAAQAILHQPPTTLKLDFNPHGL